MKRSIIIVLLVSIIGFLGCQKKSDNIFYEKKYINEIKASRENVFHYLSRNQIPGAMVAIAKDGKIIYAEAMGLASKDFEVPVTRDSKFRIAGISEVFTSFIYMRMIEEGILHPDSSVQHYLPDFPEKEYRINLSHLAYKTSGFREETIEEVNWRTTNGSISRELNKFKDDELVSITGLIESRSMFNYNLLGAIMEKATNKRFSAILKDYVTDTLKLPNTVIDNPYQTIKNRTDFYDLDIVSQVVNATFRDFRYRAPSEGLLSNAEDLVKFGNAILHSDLLSEESKKALFTPAQLMDDIPSEQAHGWVLFDDRNGNRAYGRSGAVTGGTAALLVHPGEDLVIACTINLTSSVENTPIFDIASNFIKIAENNASDIGTR